MLEQSVHKGAFSDHLHSTICVVTEDAEERTFLIIEDISPVVQPQFCYPFPNISIRDLLENYPLRTVYPRYYFDHFRIIIYNIPPENQYNMASWELDDHDQTAFHVEDGNPEVMTVLETADGMALHPSNFSMPLNNPAGRNGSAEKDYPPDEILKASLLQYAKERLTIKERLLRLQTEHDLCIGKTKLVELNNQFKVPSVRKPPEDNVAVWAILQKVAEDTQQRNGVGTIAILLSNEGMAIPRDFIRHVLSVHAPKGLAARFPGSKGIVRSQLRAIGPWHQDHQDGHDKLNAQALKMGDVALPIYGVKDQWSSFLKYLVTVPDNRLATTIGHVNLDCIEQYQAVPVTGVMDKGSELVYLFANQTALRTTHAPDIDKELYPPVLQLKSVNNTPIEGLWHWMSKTSGGNFKDLVKDRLQLGIYHPNSALHM
ncbi:hypothetical protein DXG01_016947 [Tephrocybe rancida]|nr:hypothetical protein DXG01_016947 [Tephrocybe rancida]